MLEPTTLKSLRGLGEQFLSDLIDIYLREDAGLVERIADAAERKEAEAGSMAAHRLKGSSYTLGVVSMGNLCQEIESAFDEMQFDNLMPLMASLKTELSVVTAELLRVQEKLG